MKPSPETEASRWRRQAEQDLDDGAYSLAGDRFHLACFLPTRYPNGLPGGIPAEAFRRQDAEEALAAVRALLESLRSASALD